MVEKINSLSEFVFTASADMPVDALRNIIETEMKLKVQKITPMSRGGGERFNTGRVLYSNPDGPFSQIGAVSDKVNYHVLTTQDISEGFDIIAEAQARAAAEAVEAEKKAAAAEAARIAMEVAQAKENLEKLVAMAEEAQAKANALTKEEPKEEPKAEKASGGSKKRH